MELPIHNFKVYFPSFYFSIFAKYSGLLMLASVIFNSCQNQTTDSDNPETKQEKQSIVQDTTCQYTHQNLISSVSIELPLQNKLIKLASKSDAYYILTIDKKSCAILNKKQLPIDENNALQFAQINYNNLSRIAGIINQNKFALYNTTNFELSPWLKPLLSSNLNPHEQAISEILRLEVWENYLIGFDSQKGIFVYYIANAKSPVPIPPLTQNLSSDFFNRKIFQISSNTEFSEFQLIIPQYNLDDESLTINPVLDTPADIEVIKDQNDPNSPYIIVRDAKTGIFIKYIDESIPTSKEIPTDWQKYKPQQLFQLLKKIKTQN